jgi:hypothetical protein
MQLRTWVAVTVACLCIASARSDARDIRTPNTINVFENWRIDFVRENKSLLLVGTTTGASSFFFSVQCYADSENLQVVVPLDMAETAAATETKFVRITVWNQSGDPRRVTMIRAHESVAMNVALKERPDHVLGMHAFVFLSQLDKAKEFFAIDAGGPNRIYPAQHLPAALAMFRSSCSSIRVDFDAFLRSVR